MICHSLTPNARYDMMQTLRSPTATERLIGIVIGAP
jgi:hypothetical protein